MEFPRQNIPAKQKTEKWHLDCVNYFLSQSKGDSFVNSRTKDYENYLIAAGEFDKKQFKYVTEMYGMTAPARLVNYPMISNKLDLLAGELISQPLEFSTYVINRNAIRRKNEEKCKIAMEVLLRPERRKIEKVIGSKIPDEELKDTVPPDIESYEKTPFRTNVEKQVNVGMTYLIQRWKLKTVFKRGFYDLMVSGKEFYRVRVKNRLPYAERLDPRQVIYDHDSDSETLQDSLYAGVDNLYTVNEIIDRFFLDKKTTEKLEDLANQSPQYFNDLDNTYNSYIRDGNLLKIRVVEFQWKSIKMIKYRVSPNKYDPEIDYHKMLPDDYKIGKNETDVVEKAITEIRQAVKIGHDILIDFGPKPNQIRYEEDYAHTQLDFFGVIKNAFNGNTLSIVDVLKNLQLMINLVMFHIDSALARSGGKAIVYDVSQKPANVPLRDVMYHAKNSGLILINSKQEGGQHSTFNQFKEVDMTLSQSVGQLINLKAMLEDTADKLTGISSARAGVNKTSDAVGVNERSVMQSTLITAPLFDLHYQLISDVMQGMANLMRFTWGEDGYMANIMGDAGYQTFKIDKAVALEEYGMFVKNNTKDLERKQGMMRLMETFAASGNIDPISTMKALNAESASEVETIITDGLRQVEAAQTIMKEREISVEENKNKIDATKLQVPIEVAKITAQGAIEVAKINNDVKMQMNNDLLDHKEDMQDVQAKSKLDEMMMQEANQQSAQGGQVSNVNVKK